MIHNSYTAAHAITISLVISVLYVAVLYISKHTRPSPTLTRNDPLVVYHRITWIIIATVLSIVIVPAYISFYTGKSWINCFASLRLLIGVKPKKSFMKFSVWNAAFTLIDIAKALLLTAILYIGPIVAYLFFDDGLESLTQNLINGVSDIWGIRDYIVGPITEEFVYRACIILASLSAKMGIDYMIFITPLYFGFAHIHHSYSLYIQHKYPFVSIVLSTFFQLCYTTLFGMFTAFLYLRTGTIWAPIVSHSFCNMMGIPAIGISGPRWHKTLYYALLVLGIVSFIGLLFPLTESSHGLIDWS